MTATHEDPGSALVARAQAFDLWASNFTGLYDLGLQLMWGRRLRKAIVHIKGPRVLEVSFGTGYLLAQYANGYETTGLDYNPNMIEAARRRLDACEVSARLVQGDAHEMPFADESFDTLLNTDAFTLYSDPERAMAEFYRVLAPDGRLVLLEYDFPRDRNWMGMQWMRIPKLIKMPAVEFDRVLSGAGFEFQDHPVGLWGTLHMYIATKRRARSRRA